MSDVIGFLERVGRDAQLNGAKIGSPDLSQMLASLDPLLRRAICDGDRVELGTLMGVAPACGFLAPGEEQEEDDSEETPFPGEGEEHPALDLAD